MRESKLLNLNNLYSHPKGRNSVVSFVNTFNFIYAKLKQAFNCPPLFTALKRNVAS